MQAVKAFGGSFLLPVLTVVLGTLLATYLTNNVRWVRRNVGSL